MLQTTKVEKTVLAPQAEVAAVAVAEEVVMVAEVEEEEEEEGTEGPAEQAGANLYHGLFAEMHLQDAVAAEEVRPRLQQRSPSTIQTTTVRS